MHAVCRGMGCCSAGRRYRLEGAQQMMRVCLLGSLATSMPVLAFLCRRHSSYADGRPSRLTGCWTAAMILPMYGGNTRSMTSCNRCASSQQLRTARQKAGPARYLETSGMVGPYPGPVRSEKHPMGLPELTGSQRERVGRDNTFVLDAPEPQIIGKTQ